MRIGKGVHDDDSVSNLARAGKARALTMRVAIASYASRMHEMKVEKDGHRARREILKAGTRKGLKSKEEVGMTERDGGGREERSDIGRVDATRPHISAHGPVTGSSEALHTPLGSHPLGRSNLRELGMQDSATDLRSPIF